MVLLDGHFILLFQWHRSICMPSLLKVPLWDGFDDLVLARFGVSHFATQLHPRRKKTASLYWSAPRLTFLNGKNQQCLCLLPCYHANCLLSIGNTLCIRRTFYDGVIFVNWEYCGALEEHFMMEYYIRRARCTHGVCIGVIL